MAKRKAKKNIESRLMLLAVTLVVASLAFSVGLRSAGLREQETEYIQKEAVLEKELQKEKERTAALKKKKDQANELLRNDRVNFVAQANYKEGSELDKLVKDVISEIALKDSLVRKNLKQKK